MGTRSIIALACAFACLILAKYPRTGGSYLTVVEDVVSLDDHLHAPVSNVNNNLLAPNSVLGPPAPIDGRFDYPPRVIDSWSDFAGTTYMTALYTQLALGFVGMRVCGLTLPLGGFAGPLGCVLIVGVVGFVSAGTLYAVGTYRGGKVRYRARLSVWCERQNLFAIRNEKYEDLCTPPNETRAQHSD